MTAASNSVTPAPIAPEIIREEIPQDGKEYKTSAIDERITAVQTHAFNPGRDLPAPVYSAFGPPPFQGTCDGLVAQVKDSVNNTVDSMDYSGLNPFIQIVDQLEQGKTFEESTISSKNEWPAGSCVGMSHAVLKTLREKHGIEGKLAAFKRIDGFYEHAGVIVECQDGWVLIEAIYEGEPRFFPVLFGTKEKRFPLLHESAYIITANEKGAHPPLAIECIDEKGKLYGHFEYYTNISNADDIIMKNYLFRDRAIVVAYRDGKDVRKIVKVKFDKSEVVLDDRSDPKHPIKEAIPFETIQERGLLPGLRGFMLETDRKSDFKTSYNKLNDQICKLISRISVIKDLFAKVHFQIKK